MVESITNIGPAIVDVIANLRSDDSRYNRALDLLHANPGMYVQLKDDGELLELLGILTRHKVSFSEDFVDSVRAMPGFRFMAGSTGLGFLSALTPDQRINSTILTTIGTSSNIGTVYTEEAKNLGITHHQVSVSGHHPTGIILCSPDNPEKLLAMFPGVAHELDTLAGLKPDIIHIDAYELTKGKISELIDDLIKSKKYRISLGLGNKSILVDGLSQKLTNYIQNGLVDFLLGNKEEFNALLHTQHTDLHNFNSIWINTKVPNILITDGENGLAANLNQEFLVQPAEKQEIVINTAGAGDIAAGVFVSGILAKKPAKEILIEIARYAGRVITLLEPRLPGGR